MAATKGNQWWKLRSKHGRDKIFATPEILWDACREYFESVDARKWVKQDWVGKNAKMVYRKCDTPYTKTGLYIFLDIDHKTWERYKTESGLEDFFPIITHVEQIIYTQKFEGASVGAFNANIIARDLGLTDKQEIATPDLSKAMSLFPTLDEIRQSDPGSSK